MDRIGERERTKERISPNVDDGETFSGCWGGKENWKKEERGEEGSRSSEMGRRRREKSMYRLCRVAFIHQDCVGPSGVFPQESTSWERVARTPTPTVMLSPPGIVIVGSPFPPLLFAFINPFLL
ncbi:hypothetical protein NPIL_652671 [Nephila pilipes]|uniref:Uncharacterized protein n=1 Tax=Nephila pilipes TaxID=299642 RepID=A0A8X6MW27_NEPPI|nr:hypothetical protein NPIL_652671 [Nephila pilipes]